MGEKSKVVLMNPKRGFTVNWKKFVELEKSSCGKRGSRAYNEACEELMSRGVLSLEMAGNCQVAHEVCKDGPKYKGDLLYFRQISQASAYGAEKYCPKDDRWRVIKIGQVLSAKKARKRHLQIFAVPA